MRWYRVELGDDGKVLRIEECSDGGPGTQWVFYVWAAGEASAKELAQRKRQAQLLKARRIAYVERGLCRCGRERKDKTKTRCETCRERQSVYAKRLYEKHHGRPVETPSKSESFHRRHASVRESEQLATLIAVKAKFIECSTNREFVQWLTAKIERLTKREAA